MNTTVSGTLIDPVNKVTCGARITVNLDGTIGRVEKCENPPPFYILPGFVDAHVHIESSMLTPAAFARAAVKHGTLAAVADPHEIANVLGRQGVEMMLESALQTPFVFGFGAPSCVPATSFETAGADLGVQDIKALMRLPQITHLGEMMNFPGVLNEAFDVMAKIGVARECGKPIDGHAPGLTGARLDKYISAGISTDHECLCLDEAIEKAGKGMCILIRCGSAAPAFEPFLPLVARDPGCCMFCSDDKHPDDLLNGHINTLAAAAYRNGTSIHSILMATSVNPVNHYNLPLGLLQVGHSADFQLVKDLSTFIPSEVYLKGECVFRNGETYMPEGRHDVLNKFEALPLAKGSIKACGKAGDEIHVIQAVDGALVTKHLVEKAVVKAGEIISDPKSDVIKIVVCNRYVPSAPAVGFIKGFGIRHGAMASSVAHDSHNIVAVGSSDEAILGAINEVVSHSGGLAVVGDDLKILASLPLPMAGLMSIEPIETVAALYSECDRAAKAIGSALQAPFMTLSFMALPVIPELKLTDRGLFDVNAFKHTALVRLAHCKA